MNTHALGRAAKAVACPDLIGMVTFHDSSKLLAPFAGAYSPDLASKVLELPKEVGGNGTNMAAGLRTSLTLLKTLPDGLFRRIWLLTDGFNNVETHKLNECVEMSAQMGVKINTIGFGAPVTYDPDFLARIAERTRGRFVPVDTAQKLGELLMPSRRRTRYQRGEATVFCIDVSPSMNDQLGSATKIEIVRDTMISLLRYKQTMWS